MNFTAIPHNLKPLEKNEITPVNTPQATDYNINQRPQTISNYYLGDFISSTWDGNKYSGSLGAVKDYTCVDYWTLRARSVQLFKENVYARGILRRLNRNEVHTGLNLESNPLAEILRISEEKSMGWGEESELNFTLWGKDKKQCDYYQEKTFGELQADAKLTATISGDLLVVLHVNEKTGLPMIQLIDGTYVQANLEQDVKDGNYVENGIEYNSLGRIVAYWVQVTDRNGNSTEIESKRIPAFGEKSGRRIAWMIYGSEKMIVENRGEPILSAILYSLSELNKFLDSEQRAATINSIIPFFIKKTQQTAGTTPTGRGAVSRESAIIQNSQGDSKTFNITNNLPGQVPDHLALGEEIAPFNSNRPNSGIKVFEEVIINAIAWSLEYPPETIRLKYEQNFSASRQANIELNVKLQYEFWKFGSNFCQPIYQEVVFSSALFGYIKAEGLNDARRQGDFRIVEAWTNAAWTGLVRPSVDIFKDTKAAELSLKLRVADYDYWCWRIVGMSFRNVIKKIARQNKLMEKNGITSSVDEDNNGIPITQSGDTTTEPNQNTTAKFQEKIMSMIKEIAEKQEEMESENQ